MESISLETLIRDYLQNAKTRMMQIATCIDNRPWICTVYYAVDHELNLYWISKPDRRHSLEIEGNELIAAAIAYHHQHTEEYVRGIQVEGQAKLLSGPGEEQAIALYGKQLQREDADTLLNDIRTGVNSHKAYQLKPSKFVLFDSLNFPDQPRQEWAL